MLGAVGGTKWSDPNAKVRPEQRLLGLRAALGVYANLRPLNVHPALAALSPLKTEKLHNVDVLFVRELTGGAYFGAKTRTADTATDECRYTEGEVERVTRRAFELARGRRKHLTSVDKANVLETSRLWRSTVNRVAADYPDVKLEHQLVDSMAMLLLARPASYDVVVTENLFGDILTDEAAALAGSVGVARGLRPLIRPFGPPSPVNGRRECGAACGRHNAYGFVRTHPRFGAGHRGTGCGQSDGRHPVRRVAAAAFTGAGSGSDGGRSRGGRGVGERSVHARPRWRRRYRRRARRGARET